jgi:hypothetical protein
MYTAKCCYYFPAIIQIYCRVAEFAPPGELLQNTDGHFSRLMAAERRTANKPTNKDTSSSDSENSDSDTDSSSTSSDSSSDTDTASDSEASDSGDAALLEGML